MKKEKKIEKRQKSLTNNNKHGNGTASWLYERGREMNIPLILSGSFPHAAHAAQAVYSAGWPIASYSLTVTFAARRSFRLLSPFVISHAAAAPAIAR